MKSFSLLASVLFALATIGCNNAPPTQYALSQGAVTANADCVDADGDGFGDGCEAGPDCDDHDATVAESCAGKRDDEKCAEGEEKVCDVMLASHNGVTSCFWGTRLCKDGAWSACENSEDHHK
jgi:hypothetical protein